MEGLNERIKMLRSELGLNQSEFGERIGVKKSGQHLGIWKNQFDYPKRRLDLQGVQCLP